MDEFSKNALTLHQDAPRVYVPWTEGGMHGKQEIGDQIEETSKGNPQ